MLIYQFKICMLVSLDLLCQPSSECNIVFFSPITVDVQYYFILALGVILLLIYYFGCMRIVSEAPTCLCPL